MYGALRLICVTIWLVASCSVTAGVAAALESLASSTQWRRLLHMPIQGGESDILSEGFFLSPQGRSDAQAELRATLDAYQMPWTDNPDAHPRCRYPARYQWLSQYVPLTDYRRIEPRCRRLNQWSRLDSVGSVSLLLVSGYFGNPASTFGHALLRFNSSQLPGVGGLLDTGLNFGAVVPAGEGMLPYVFKGLTGGYRAGFADKDFYSYDLVYGHNEFRDMWEYELALPLEQQDRLILHAWELMGREFTYYFLTRNCALRLAELLEVATDQEVSPTPSGWYVPVELFNDLQRHEQTQSRRVIKQVRYLPSNEKVLNAQFAVLNDEDRSAVRHVLAQPELDADFTGVSAERTQQILDVLTAYYSYRLAAAGGEVDESTRIAKDKLLLKRLQLPPRQEAPAMPPVRLSPAEGSPPMQMGLALHFSEQASRRTKLRWSPFSYGHMGFNGIEPNEMVLMDVSLKIGQERGAELSALEIFRVRKMVLDRDVLTDSSPWSWRAAMRYLGREDTNDRSRWQMKGGTGMAWRLSSAGYAYAMTEASLTSGSAPFALHPMIGFMFQQPGMKLSVEAGRRIGTRKGTSHAEVAMRASKRIGRAWEVRTDIERQKHDSAQVSVLFHY